MATVEERDDELCLENIDEFVHDENKIVTCKWLSLTLKIQINHAKRLLYRFLQQQRNKKDKDVSATYFVAGFYQNNGIMEHRCLVVSEEDVEVTRTQLKPVTSCHVYSVQRSQLKDTNALYMTDYDAVKENLADCTKYSSIHCKHATIARKSSRVSDTVADKRNKDVIVSEEKTLKGGSGDSVQNGSAGGGDGSGPKKAESKGSIASMFAQTTKKMAEANGKPKEESSNNTARKEEKKGGKTAAKKGGVMDFFANAKPAAKPKAQEKQPTPEPEVPQKEKTKPANSSVSQEKGGKKRDSKRADSQSKKKTRPQDDSGEEDGPQKKRRRRIKNDLFDSSSSDEEVEMEAESPVPSPAKEPSPEPESPVLVDEPEKVEDAGSEKHVNGNKVRRRRRKLVPKTYLDEDGFMVTEKVWESESTDASEVEEESKKKAAPGKPAAPAPAKKASPQKRGSPAKGKQTSLMSFFKKK